MMVVVDVCLQVSHNPNHLCLIVLYIFIFFGELYTFLCISELLASDSAAPCWFCSFLDNPPTELPPCSHWAPQFSHSKLPGEFLQPCSPAPMDVPTITSSKVCLPPHSTTFVCLSVQLPTPRASSRAPSPPTRRGWSTKAFCGSDDNRMGNQCRL